jgi:beta-glucosidase-like glycosyl hydrolase
MRETGRLVFPALRWHSETGFTDERDTIDTALRLGAGGFCIFGGSAAAVSELTASLRQQSRVPLLIGSDLERGAGQQFPEATQLPPLAALGLLDDLTATRHAAELTAREALALGINCIFAPVADVDLEPRNPIVGSRSFGTDPVRVAAHVAAWIDGCHAEGVLCCAKHFPGHGRTVDDSHATLPRVAVDRSALEHDLEPFRSAIDAGVDAVMTAHVIFDALDAGAPATLSRAILAGLLRSELCYDGLIVTDALNMDGVLQATGGSETRAAIAALNAGCDAILYPAELSGLADALEKAVGGDLDAQRVRDATARVDAAARRAATGGSGAWGLSADRTWADSLALRSLVVARGSPAAPAACDVITVDDDLRGPFAPPDRVAFVASLRDCGVDARTADRPSGERPSVVAVYADTRAWKGAPGLSATGAAAVRSVLDADKRAIVVLFGHPRLAAALPGEHVLAAWGGEAIMQRAAAHWLAERR